MHPETLMDLQYTVLGSMMRYPNTVGPCMAELQQEDFPALGALGVFLAIRRLYFAAAPINEVSVMAEAGEEFEPYVSAAVLAAQSDPHYYVGKLREVSRLTALQRAGLDLSSSADQGEADKAISQINELCSSRRGVRVVSIADAVAGYMGTLDQGAPDFIKTGIQELDKDVYLRPGKFMVLGAYASAGKTLLALQMAKEMAKSRKVGFFSCETDSYDIAVRCLTAESRVWNRRILTHDLNSTDKAALRKAAESLAPLQLDIIEAGGFSVADVQAVTLSRRYDVIFVDYLQLLRGGGKGRYEDVTEISLGLHTLAQQHKVLVVALAQLARPEKRDGKPVPPSMSSLRESGQIEQDADVVALMYPEDPEDNRSRRVFKVSKNKEGEKLTLKFAFDGATQRVEVVRDHPDAAAYDSRFRKAGKADQPPDEWADKQQKIF